MNKVTVLFSLLIFLSLSFSAVASAQENPNDLFQKALAKERVDGNLEEAIQLFRQVVQQFGNDRPLAAKALVQIGRCYERLGKDEARNAYDRVLRDFSDQAQQVEEARARLASLRVAPLVQEKAGPILTELKLPAGGGEPKTLLSVDRNELVERRPGHFRFSPDGNFVSFSRGDKQARDIFLLPSKGGKPIPVTTHPADARDPIWAPDGKTLLFLSNRSFGRIDLWALPGADGAPELWQTKLTNAKPEPFRLNLGPSETIAYFSPSWSPDGAKMLFSAETKLYQLLLMANFLPKPKADK